MFAAVLHGAADARADALIDEYDAYIGFEDTYNSRGDTLTEPWQVIRQDRASDHRYGITQRGDAPDDDLEVEVNE